MINLVAGSRKTHDEGERGKNIIVNYVIIRNGQKTVPKDIKSASQQNVDVDHDPQDETATLKELFGDNF